MWNVSIEPRLYLVTLFYKIAVLLISTQMVSTPHHHCRPICGDACILCFCRRELCGAELRAATHISQQIMFQWKPTYSCFHWLEWEVNRNGLFPWARVHCVHVPDRHACQVQKPEFRIQPSHRKKEESGKQNKAIRKQQQNNRNTDLSIWSCHSGRECFSNPNP